MNQDLYSAISSADQLTQEPEKIKKWREEQKKRIETKDAEEELKKKEWKEAAKKELDDWYKNRQEQLVKTRENNKYIDDFTYIQSLSYLLSFLLVRGFLNKLWKIYEKTKITL